MSFERKELHVSEGKGSSQERKKVFFRKKQRRLITSIEHGFSRVQLSPLSREVSGARIPFQVTELAQAHCQLRREVIKALMGMGLMATIFFLIQVLDSRHRRYFWLKEMGMWPKQFQENEVEQALGKASIESKRGEPFTRHLSYRIGSDWPW